MITRAIFNKLICRFHPKTEFLRVFGPFLAQKARFFTSFSPLFGGFCHDFCPFGGKKIGFLGDLEGIFSQKRVILGPSKIHEVNFGPQNRSIFEILGHFGDPENLEKHEI